MHEYALVQSLVARVEEEARRRSAVAVHGVRVAVGGLAGVDPELLRTAYDTFRAGTACEHAPLELVTVPVTWSCPACGRPIPAGEPLHCTTCRCPARMSENGDALTLEAIELEVP